MQDWSCVVLIALISTLGGWHKYAPNVNTTFSELNMWEWINGGLDTGLK